MKKKLLRFASVFILAMVLIPACDLLEDCGTCTWITDYGDGTIDTGVPIPLCGEDYQAKLDADPIVVGDMISYWECE